MYRKEKSSFLLVLGVILIIVSLITPTVLIVNNIQFNQTCGGYLKQAADANTVIISTRNNAMNFFMINTLFFL